MNRKIGELLMGLALLLAVFFAARHLGLSEASRAQSRAASGRERKVVAIDAGHGGNDPGKVGVNGSLEKEDRKSTRLNSSHL